MAILKIHSYYEAPKDQEVCFYFNGVYLHGEVEHECGYDICFPANPEDFPTEVRDVTDHFDNAGDVTGKYLFLNGIYPCLVDNKYKCTAFLWYDDKNHHQPWWMHGLIVLNTDKKAYEDAKRKYNERAMSI